MSGAEAAATASEAQGEAVYTIVWDRLGQGGVLVRDRLGQGEVLVTENE